jgi:hypothetical protein
MLVSFGLGARLQFLVRRYITPMRFVRWITKTKASSESCGCKRFLQRAGLPHNTSALHRFLCDCKISPLSVDPKQNCIDLSVPDVINS